MPPRFTYWTIILDGQPTAFRAAEREDLLPTLKQLQTKNPTAEMKWFARGRVWDSPEEASRARAEAEAAYHAAQQKEGRGRDWRPGGEHRDPREKFKKETFQARRRRERKAADLARDRQRPAEGRPPREDRRHDRPKTFGSRPQGAHGPRPEFRRDDRPKRFGPRPQGAHGPRPEFRRDDRPKRFGGRGPAPHGRKGPQNRGFGGGEGGGFDKPREDRPWKGGGFNRPPRRVEQRPAPPAPAPQAEKKPIAPVERVAPPRAEHATPPVERVAPPVVAGPPAPPHKTKLPRLRKP